MRLRKDDTVIVTSGKDKGKTGKITQSLPQLNKVVVDGINIVKRHTKPTQSKPQGGIIEQAQPIWASKVAIVNPDDAKRGTRVGYKVKGDGSKVRVAKQANDKEIR